MNYGYTNMLLHVSKYNNNSLDRQYSEGQIDTLAAMRY